MTDFDTNQLLTAFLDACRDDNRDAAAEALNELRYRVWLGSSPLPRDPRPSHEETKRLLAASVALAQCRDALAAMIDNSMDRAYVTQQAEIAVRLADAALK